MQARELARGLERHHRQDVNRLARRGGLGGHVGAVLGDQDVVGGVQEGEHRVRALTIPDPARQVAQPPGHDRLRRLGRSAGEGQHQRSARGSYGRRDPVRQRRGMVRRQVEGLGPAPDQDGDPRAGQDVQPPGDGGGGLGQGLGRDAVGRAGDRHDPRPGQAVVRRRHDQIEQRRVEARILGLDDEGLAAAQAPHGQRQGQGRPACRDPQVRPGLAFGREGRVGRQHPRRLQRDRQPVEGGSPAHLFHVDVCRSQTRDRLGEAERLIFHAGAAVRDDRDTKGLWPYFHSTLRIS